MSPSLCAAHICGCYVKTSENWIRTQVEHLEGVSNIVLSFSTKNVSTPPEGIALFETNAVKRRINTAWNRLFGYYPSFYRAIQRHDALLLHAHFGPMGYRMLPLARKTGLPLVTTFYGYDLSYLPKQQPAWRDRYAELFDAGAAFLLEGSHMRDQLIQLGCPPDKAMVQHLGVEVNDWKFVPRTRAEDAPLRILFASRFTEKKGFRYAFEAFARAVNAGANLTLTVIGDTDGTDRSQREKQRVLDQIRGNDLRNRVALRGFVDHSALVQAYYDHHVLLAPSVTASDGDVEGGAPVTLIEAQATGLPVISSLHCDIPEVVKHEITGLLAPEKDIHTLADHLHTLASTPEALPEFGRAGRKHVEHEYDAHKQGKQLAKRYQSILKTTP